MFKKSPYRIATDIIDVVMSRGSPALKAWSDENRKTIRITLEGAAQRGVSRPCGERAGSVCEVKGSKKKEEKKDPNPYMTFINGEWAVIYNALPIMAPKHGEDGLAKAMTLYTSTARQLRSFDPDASVPVWTGSGDFKALSDVLKPTAPAAQWPKAPLGMDGWPRVSKGHPATVELSLLMRAEPGSIFAATPFSDGNNWVAHDTMIVRSPGWVAVPAVVNGGQTFNAQTLVDLLFKQKKTLHLLMRGDGKAPSKAVIDGVVKAGIDALMKGPGSPPRTNPSRIIRRNPASSEAACQGEILLDSEGRRYPVVYRVVAAALNGSTVVTSHNPQTFDWQNGPPLNYPPEFQTRDLSEQKEVMKINQIAHHLEPIRLLGKHLDPTLGAPVVWPHDGRLYVLGGNGRTMAFLRAPEKQYELYLKTAECRWDCFPSDPAPEGTRWLLVREVQGVDFEEAVQLAAASQKSTAASESPLAEAVGLIRSLSLRIEDMPPFRWSREVTASNMLDFLDVNRQFYRYIVSRLDAAKAKNVEADDNEKARYLRAATIGFLPQEAQAPGLYETAAMEDALIGAAPSILTTHSDVVQGRLLPAYDLWVALRDAVPVFQELRQKGLSVPALKKKMVLQREQTGIGGAKRLVDASPFAWALALALNAAAGTKKPEARIVELLQPYLDAIDTECYRPVGEQRGMFGGGGMFGSSFAPKDLCEERRKPPETLFAEAVRDAGEKKFYKDFYEIVYGEVPAGESRDIFSGAIRNPFRVNAKKGGIVAQLVALADQVAEGLDKDLPLVWHEPITAVNARRFQEMNPAFYRAATQHLINDTWNDVADALNGALLAILPKSLLRRMEYEPALVQRNTVACIPTIITLHLAAHRGEIPEAMDPVKFLPGGPGQALHERLQKDAVVAMSEYADKCYRNDPRQTRLFALTNPGVVQTILFDKKVWSKSDSRAWLGAHGYRARGFDSTTNFHRWRQKDPSLFRPGSFRTIPFGESGIQAVIGREV